MKRWTLVLLLLLLPFTMAPRTSVNPDGTYEVSVDINKSTVKVGSALPVHVRVVNLAQEPAPVTFTLEIAMSGGRYADPGKDAYDWVRLPSACQVSGTTLTCTTAPIKPGKHANVNLVVRPAAPGVLGVVVQPNGVDDRDRTVSVPVTSTR